MTDLDRHCPRCGGHWTATPEAPVVVHYCPASRRRRPARDGVDTTAFTSDEVRSAAWSWLFGDPTADEKETSE